MVIKNIANNMNKILKLSLSWQSECVIPIINNLFFFSHW